MQVTGAPNLRGHDRYDLDGGETGGAHDIQADMYV